MNSECCVPDCKLSFKSWTCFRNHVTNKHIGIRPKQPIKCDINNCNEIIMGINDLYKHYYMHLRNRSSSNEAIKCFYRCCEHTCSTVRSFQDHLSKYHSNQKRESNLKEKFCL